MEKQIAALATDEGHIVMWDIDALLSDYGAHPRVTVPTDRIIPAHWLTIDKAYAHSTDASKPLLLFEIPHDMLYIADGNHRLYKAAAEHIPEMNVIILPQEIHLKYLFRSSVDTYYEVMEGLRGEGIFIENFNVKKHPYD